MLQSEKMTLPDFGRRQDFEQRHAARKLDVTAALRTHPDPQIRSALIGDGKTKALAPTTMKATVLGVSFVLAAQNLAELQREATVYAESELVPYNYVNDAARKALIENSRNALLELSRRSLGRVSDEAYIVFLTKMSVAVATLSHVSDKDVSAADIEERATLLEQLTKVAMKRMLTRAKKVSLPSRPKTEPTAVGRRAPQTEDELRPPSLNRLPGQGRLPKLPGDRFPF